jgi:hypothetical protein
VQKFMHSWLHFGTPWNDFWHQSLTFCRPTKHENTRMLLEWPAAGAGSPESTDSAEFGGFAFNHALYSKGGGRILRLRPCRQPPFQQATADKLIADVDDLFDPKL